MEREGRKMQVKELQEKAFKNAKDKGFHDMEQRVLRKMKNLEFDDEEIEAVRLAFMSQSLVLITTEIGESIQELRKGNNEKFREEIADIIIRAGDFAGSNDIDLEMEVKRKMAINKSRPKMHERKF